MTEAEAKDFIKDSVVQDTWYHGTTDLAANGIQQAGFQLSSPNATLNNGLIDGIFLTDVKGRAEDYAMGAAGERGGKPRILSVKLNIKNLKEFDHDGLWNFAVKALGRTNFTIDEVRKALIAQGIDAVKVNDGVIGQTYISVFDPKNVIVTDVRPII